MPHGFFTIEEWKRPKNRATGQWLPILHLDAGQSLTEAFSELEKRGKPGLFRVLQMQRCVWGEMQKGRLRLRGSHASSPKSLEQMVKIYEGEGGHRPVEKARQDRIAAKAKRAK